MHPIKKWLVICLALVLAFSCTGAMAEAPAQAKTGDMAQWTVLLYLCGTDLESDGAMVSYNLAELAKTTPSTDVHVAMQTGGTKQWHAQEAVGLDIASDKLQRYHFDAEGFTLDEELPLDNMASAQTLTDFIRWGAKEYPAEKYLLVLWDHGGGSLRGLISDELHDKAVMPLDQLEIALKDANVPLEAILLDTCLMATLETAQAVQSSANYLIASQEVVPGKGSAYQTWMQYLYDTPTCNGARLGKVVCDSIQQKYAELGMATSSRQLTFSVIDLQKIDAVSKAFDELFVEVGKLLEDPAHFYAFGYTTAHMQRYIEATMVDIADMAGRARNKAVSNKTAGALIEAVNDAVVYSIKGDQRSYSNGLSFYYDPTADVSTLDHYARSCKSAPYLAFLDAASMSWTAPDWVYTQTPRLHDISREDYTVETAISITADGLPKLTITNAPTAVAEVRTLIFQHDKATDTWVRVGEDADVMGDFEEGVFFGKFPESWFTFNDRICQMDIVEETDSYILYRVPFQAVLPDMNPISLEFRMAYVFAPPQLSEAGDDEAMEEIPEGYFDFYGVWDKDSADSVSLPSRNASDLSNYYGTPIQMVQQRMSLPGYEDRGVAASTTFTLTPDLQMDTKVLPRGEYICLFKVTDVFGKTIVSDRFDVKWDGKNAVFSGAEVEAEEDPVDVNAKPAA